MDEEKDLCPVCAGSGEGVADGTRCYACKGWGVVRDQEDDHDY